VLIDCCTFSWTSSILA